MSIKNLGNGWKEYWFYYGNANYPPDETYRYNAVLDFVYRRVEQPLTVDETADDGSLLIELAAEAAAFGSAPLFNPRVCVVGRNAYLFTWERVTPRMQPELWAFFMREKAKEDARASAAPPA